MRTLSRYQVYNLSDTDKAALLHRCRTMTADEWTALIDSKRDAAGYVVWPYADLRGAHLVGVDFSLAALAACYSVVPDIEDEPDCQNLYTTFHDVNWDGADLRGATMTEAIFERCSFRDADFAGASFFSCVFDGCQMNGTRFQGADVSFAPFDGSDLRGADFSGAFCKGARFNHVDLTTCNFDGADFGLPHCSIATNPTAPKCHNLLGRMYLHPVWDWSELLIEDEEVVSWCLSRLAPWVRKDSDVPDEYRERMLSLRAG